MGQQLTQENIQISKKIERAVSLKKWSCLVELQRRVKGQREAGTALNSFIVTPSDEQSKLCLLRYTFHTTTIQSSLSFPLPPINHPFHPHHPKYCEFSIKIPSSPFPSYQMGEEFQESEVFWPDHHCQDDRRTVGDVGNYNYEEVIASPRRNSRLKRKKSKQTNSLPVSIPENMTGQRTSWFHCQDSDDGDDVYGEDEMVPPHLMVARRIAGKMAFSVCTGNGRTLKGRDLSQVRNSILRMTGFLET